MNLLTNFFDEFFFGNLNISLGECGSYFLSKKELSHICPKNDRGKTGAERDVREEEDSLSQNYL